MEIESEIFGWEKAMKQHQVFDIMSLLWLILSYLAVSMVAKGIALVLAVCYAIASIVVYSLTLLYVSKHRKGN
jgi:hypothetical protein